MSTHTPGPWTLGTRSEATAHNWFPVVALHEGCTTFGKVIAWGLQGSDPDETAEANARLIALAPELAEYVASSASAGCATAAALIAKLSLTSTK